MGDQNVSRFLLVHSPLVGPSTLTPLAAALGARGNSVITPDLRGAATWTAFVERAVGSARSNGFQPEVVVAHSGAGAVLPAIASEVGATRLLFIDSVLPPESGTWTPSDLMRSRLNTMAGADRFLPAWHEWWNPNMMRRLVSNETLRTAIESECRQVSLDFYDSEAAQPDGWSSPESSVYIQLSGAYADEATEARNRAWPVLMCDGSHLDTATQPDRVVDLVVQAVGTHPVRVGDLESLRRRGGVTVPRSASKLLVVAPPDSGPFAIINECAHQGAELLAGYVSATSGRPWIECPLHSWRFDLVSGQRLIRDEVSVDPLDCVRTFPCAVDRQGMIWVEPPVGGS